MHPGITAPALTRETSPGKCPKWGCRLHQTLLLYQDTSDSRLLLTVSTSTPISYKHPISQAALLLSDWTGSFPPLAAPQEPRALLGRADTDRDPERRGGRGLHAGVLLWDAAGHGAPLPAPLRGGLCGHTEQGTVTNTPSSAGTAQGQHRNATSPCKMWHLPPRCPRQWPHGSHSCCPWNNIPPARLSPSTISIFLYNCKLQIMPDRLALSLFPVCRWVNRSCIEMSENYMQSTDPCTGGFDPPRGNC